MADWHDSANRALSLLQSDSSDAGTRTTRILNHVLDEQNLDSYISKDFYNVQQTAGGLPDTLPMQQFVDAITGHVRDDLGTSSFDFTLSDDDFRTALMSIDSNIVRHMEFLNGVVHQIAPGQVHQALWQLILDSRNDDSSIYSCYRDFLVDA
ncbi:MAG TPA: hypothetical protein VMT53_22685 [Terriglobales bacterium]|nr:hypothetical protein [Terriglobales bacterium]